MKEKELWLIANKVDGSNAFDCLAYATEPVHGAIKGLSTKYVLASEYEALMKEYLFLKSLDDANSASDPH